VSKKAFFQFHWYRRMRKRREKKGGEKRGEERKKERGRRKSVSREGE
jgi:hypothetical protein